MKYHAILIKPNDNVATALEDLEPEKACRMSAGSGAIKLTVLEHISFGHKLSVMPIKQGDNVIKYGEVIGRATNDIPKGAYAHIHNIESLRGRGDLKGSN